MVERGHIRKFHFVLILHVLSIQLIGQDNYEVGVFNLPELISRYVISFVSIFIMTNGLTILFLSSYSKIFYNKLFVFTCSNKNYVYRYVNRYKMFTAKIKLNLISIEQILTLRRIHEIA